MIDRAHFVLPNRVSKMMILDFGRSIRWSELTELAWSVMVRGVLEKSLREYGEVWLAFLVLDRSVL